MLGSRHASKETRSSGQVCARSPDCFPVAVRASGQSGIGPGRYRGAIFAGDNPYSRLVWASLQTRSKSGPAIKDAVAAIPDVRCGFQLGAWESEMAQSEPTEAEAA